MRPRSPVRRLSTRFTAAMVALLVVHCAAHPTPAPRGARVAIRTAPSTVGAPADSAAELPTIPALPANELAIPTTDIVAPPTDLAAPTAAPTTDPTPPPPTEPSPAPTEQRCASVPPLNPDGSVPPAPPHAPLGVDVAVPGDRPAYVLPGAIGDARVIVYLHGMCGDVTAADHFREAVRAHGTLLALRGDTPCPGGRFKWRGNPDEIQARIEAAFARVNAEHGGDLNLQHALLFGYSQGAERAERLAARFPRKYPRLVLGGPPTRASPARLVHAERVAILGGELESTETMRAGYEALQSAGIDCRYYTLECAYHGYFGAHPETQLAEVLDWVSLP